MNYRGLPGWSNPFLLILLAGLLAACSIFSPEKPAAPSPDLQSIDLASPTPSLTPDNSSTPDLSDPEELAAIGSATPEPQSASSLRYVFPTPGPAPQSAWRPPLYDVPWAPGPSDHFYFSRPIGADEVNWPLADYRYGGIFPGTTDIVHTGIDIDAPAGTPVLAAAPGKVVWAGWGLFFGAYNTKDPYGMAVAIQHDFGYQGKRLYTIYAHMSEIDVVVGQRLNTHDQIGLVGDTGKTTGPHLHFEVRIGPNEFFYTQNPELWLAPPQGWGVLVGRLTGPDGLPIHNKEVTVTSRETGTFWVVRTYGPKATNSDPYYRENLVLSDLPAGRYRITLGYDFAIYNQTIEILPGRISYFTFAGKNRFKTELPPTPIPSDFLTPPTHTPGP